MTDTVSAADKQFTHGIGPGCFSLIGDVLPKSRAMPPLRIRKVCESLNIPDDPDTPEDEARVRCFLDSVCRHDFLPALRTIPGVFEELAADG